MSELEFMRGFMLSSGLSEPTRAGRAYAQWLEREGYAEVERIDLEAGGYESGLEVGKRWRETNQSN